MEQKRSRKEMDMIHGGLAGKLVLFAMPLAASSILQQLFNSADVAVVGRFAGSSALAAVGSCVALVGLFVNFIVGFSVGPNAALAYLIGRNQRSEIRDMLHTIIAMGLLLGLLFCAAAQLAAAPLLRITGTPEEIHSAALLYIRIYYLGIPFMFLYNFGAAILRSFGDTRRPMYCLFLSGTVNVLLNLLFVIIFRLSVAGVALATTVSNLLSASLVLGILHMRTDDFRFRFRDLRLRTDYLKKIFSIGLPAGVQCGIFSFSNIFVQAGINSFGAAAIAGASLALNFEYFTYDIAAAFAQAALTFISQNYGAGEIGRCRRVFCLCVFYGVFLTEILCAVFTVRAAFFAGLYSTSPDVIHFAVLRMYSVMSVEGICGTYEVECSALRALGHSAEPTFLTILGTVGFRLLWLGTVFRMCPTYLCLCLVYPASWLFTGASVLIVLLKYNRKLPKAPASP